MTHSRDVLITGLGVISPIGLTVAELLSSLMDARSGISLWDSPYLSKKFPAGIIKQDFSGEFTKLELPFLDRCSQLAILAARQAMQDAGLEQFAKYGQRAGLYYASLRGGAKTEDEWVREFYVQQRQASNPYVIMASMENSASAQISIRHKILGPVMTICSACAASGVAIGEAYRAIQHGYLDVALVGGADSAFTAPFIGSWEGVQALAPPDTNDVRKSCRPFSKNRAGLVLGEGAVFILLESREHALKRKANCYGRLSGYGIASDGYHIGFPKMEGQIMALNAALADATLTPEHINYFNAHATATMAGDPIEAAAIRQVFGNKIEHQPFVGATKSLHGHLLGAACIIEVAASTLAITHSFLPPTAHLDEVDVNCELNHVANKSISNHPVEHAMSFSAGFGGTNVALIVSKEHHLRQKFS